MNAIARQYRFFLAALLSCACGIASAQTVVMDRGSVSVRTDGAAVDIDPNGKTRVQTWESRSSSGSSVTAPESAISASGNAIVIDGVGKSFNAACNGKTVEVAGSDNKVRLSGYCAKISVDGTSNHVTVAQVGAVHVEGASNVVAWREKTRGKGPKVSSDGVDNRVYQSK